MKIGILVTGTPPQGLEPKFGDYPGMFRALIGEHHDYVNYDVERCIFPARPEDHDAYVVTGSPAGVYDDYPWIEPLKQFLRAVKGKAKLVGVCFGHQVMAEAFGGHAAKSEHGWRAGLHRFHVVERAPWMDDADSFAIPVSHQDRVVEQPPHSRLLATGEYNRFGLLAYEDQPAISFQCHPEFTPEYAAALAEARRARLVDAEAAIASLQQPNDRPRVAQWIRRFLEQP